MCGRARCTLSPEAVIRAAGGTHHWRDRERYQPSHNLTPGSWTPVIYRAEPTTDAPDPNNNNSTETEIQTMRWGLVPSFTKENEKPDPWRMFNARSESITEKPSFRRLVPSKRCLVLVNGFYEWAKEGKGGKQPYYIYLEDDKVHKDNDTDKDSQCSSIMVLAGLYDVWQGPDKEVLYTYTILTTDSSKRLYWLHDRMPVILRDTSAQELWLDTSSPANVQKLHSILGPYNGDDLKWHAVTKAMSSPAFQGEQCSAELKKPSVASFFKPKSKAATTPTIKTTTITGGGGLDNEVVDNSSMLSTHAAPAVNPDEKISTTPATTTAAEKGQQSGQPLTAPEEAPAASCKEDDDIKYHDKLKHLHHQGEVLINDDNKGVLNDKKRKLKEEVEQEKQNKIKSPGSSSKKRPKTKLKPPAGQRDITSFFK